MGMLRMALFAAVRSKATKLKNATITFSYLPRWLMLVSALVLQIWLISAVIRQ